MVLNIVSKVSFNKGEGFFVINNDEDVLHKGIQTGLPAGVYCNLASSDINECSNTLTVD